MRYLGGKRRIAGQIVPIMEAVRKQGQVWVEPFVGGAGTFQHAANPRLGSDLNPYVVALLKAMRDGWDPPANVTEEEYAMTRRAPHLFPPERVAFIALGASFGSKWFGGYARGLNGKGEPRNYPREMRTALLKEAPRLAGAMLMSGAFDALPIPPRSLIYCDPPYEGTTEYKDKGFDHCAFWDWANAKAAEGHTVFVSEYKMPIALWSHYWAEVWSGEVTDPMRNRAKAKANGNAHPAKPDGERNLNAAKARPFERLFMRGAPDGSHAKIAALKAAIKEKSDEVPRQ